MKHYFSTDGSWGASSDLIYCETSDWPEWWQEAIDAVRDSDRALVARAIHAYATRGEVSDLIADYVEEEVTVEAINLHRGDRFMLAGNNEARVLQVTPWACDHRGYSVEVCYEVGDFISSVFVLDTAPFTVIRKGGVGA